jgi:hypothetical protein
MCGFGSMQAAVLSGSNFGGVACPVAGLARSVAGELERFCVLRNPVVVRA